MELHAESSHIFHTNPGIKKFQNNSQAVQEIISTETFFYLYQNVNYTKYYSPNTSDLEG